MKKLVILLMLVAMMTAVFAFAGCGNTVPPATSAESSSEYSRSKRSSSMSSVKEEPSVSQPTPSVSTSTTTSESTSTTDSTSDSSVSSSSDSSVSVVPEEVTNLIASINAIGEVTFTNYTEKATAITSATTAYEALSAENKALVTNYATLTSAKTAYDSAVSAQPLVDEFKEDVNAIGTVEYTTACKTLLDAADTAYNAIPTAYQSFVATEKTTLDGKKNEYLLAKTTADINDFISKVNAIGTVEYTPASKALIDSASTAYANVPVANQQDANVLTAKATLDQAITDYTTAEYNSKPQEVKDVMTAINAIGEITSANYVSKEATIVSAETAYNALSTENKALVSNYATLTSARNAYNEFVAAEQAIQALLSQFRTDVTAIGEVNATNYTEKLALINTAKTSYSAILPEERKADVATEKATLDSAETAYNGFVTLAQKNEFINKVNAIGTVEYTTACNTLIESAETAYTALSAELKADADVIASKATLDTARSQYVSAMATAKINDFTTAVTAVTTATLENTPAYKTLLDNADTAYSAIPTANLTDTAVVEAKASLDTAKKNYNDLVAKDTFMTAYNALPASLSADNKAQFSAVISAYDALTADQKTLVGTTVAGKIEEFRTAIGSMKEAYVIDFTRYSTLVKCSDSKRIYFNNTGMVSTTTNFYAIKGSGSFAVKNTMGVTFADNSVPAYSFGIYSSSISSFKIYLNLDKKSTVKIYFGRGTSSSALVDVASTGYTVTGSGTASTVVAPVATTAQVSVGTSKVAVMTQTCNAGEAVFEMIESSSRVSIFRIEIIEA